MPKFVKTDLITDDEWNIISILLNDQGYMNPYKIYPMLVENPQKHDVIAEDVLIKLLDYLYFNKQYITPALFSSDPFWNQITSKKEQFPLSDHIAITLMSHRIIYKLLQQIHHRSESGDY